MKLPWFNGGRIAACEIQIALAFGARIEIISGSERATDELHADLSWWEKNPPRLHRLILVEDYVGKSLKN